MPTRTLARRTAVAATAVICLSAARPAPERTAERAAFTRRLVAAAVGRASVKVRYAPAPTRTSTTAG
jgi:hypothetical protein